MRAHVRTGWWGPKGNLTSRDFWALVPAASVPAWDAWKGEGGAQELTHQGDDEGEDMQQPVQDFGGTFGLVSEDAVNQQGCGNEREGRCPRRSGSLPAAGSEETHLGRRRSELRAFPGPSATRNREAAEETRLRRALWPREPRHRPTHRHLPVGGPTSRLCSSLILQSHTGVPKLLTPFSYDGSRIVQF